MFLRKQLAHYIERETDLTQDQFEAGLSPAENPHLGGIGSQEASNGCDLACLCVRGTVVGQDNKVRFVLSIEVYFRSDKPIGGQCIGAQSLVF